MRPLRPRHILPVGTKVVTLVDTAPIGGGQVCPAGIVGVVTAAPVDADHAYRVRYANGEEALIRQPQFALLKDYQRGDIGLPAEGDSLDPYIIYRCLVGSRAYGLDTETSDRDVRGIYLPPAEMHWSLYGVPEQMEYPETEECYWELQKFLVLGLKANPNALECLYTPAVEHATDLARELLAMRDAFLSRLVYQTYQGYVLSQFKKLERGVRNQGAVKWKHVMHLMRLLLSGITVLREGFVPVRVEEHRDALLAIRHGELPWDQIDAWRSRLHAELDAAYAATRLPERPDYARVNDFLVRARRSMV